MTVAIAISPSFVSAFTTGVAAYLTIAASAITITGTVASSRRLLEDVVEEGSEQKGGRQLQTTTTSVTISYTVTVTAASGQTAASIQATSTASVATLSAALINAGFTGVAATAP